MKVSIFNCPLNRLTKDELKKVSLFNRPLNRLVDEDFHDRRPQKQKKNVKFGLVDVYKFGLTQGLDTVPCMGAVSLGMEKKHHGKHRFSLEEYTIYKDAENRIKHASWESALQNSERMRRKREILNEKRLKKRKKKKFADKVIESSISSSSEPEFQSDDENLAEFSEQSRVGEPLRRLILTKSGVQIDENVTNESMKLAISRIQCGCRCTDGKCWPDKCKCALEGVKCQVDYTDDTSPLYNFPCTCTLERCKNPEGRIEPDPKRIRNHFLGTLMRIKAAESK